MDSYRFSTHEASSSSASFARTFSWASRRLAYRPGPISRNSAIGSMDAVSASIVRRRPVNPSSSVQILRLFPSTSVRLRPVAFRAPSATSSVPYPSAISAWKCTHLRDDCWRARRPTSLATMWSTAAPWTRCHREGTFSKRTITAGMSTRSFPTRSVWAAMSASARRSSSERRRYPASTSHSVRAEWLGAL